MSEKEELLKSLDWEVKQAMRLIQALPPGREDFKPDPKGPSMGELAWHLAGLEAYMTYAIGAGGVRPGLNPPGIEQPRTFADMVPAFERVHRDAVARVEALQPSDFDRTIPFPDGRPVAIRHVLHNAVIHHLIHHRGQLMLMCRLAGGTPPGIYGPTREDSERIQAGAKQG